MKLSALQSKASKSQASVLIIAMICCGVIGVILLSYLQLTQGRATVRARSHAWNSAIPVLEAGIEEAFTHLRNDTNNMTANNWTLAGGGASAVYRRSRTNDDGTYFVATISNAVSMPYTAPTIYSQGFVPAPLGDGYITRIVRVETKQPKVFSKAIAARNTIQFGGAGSIIDSFDSSNTNASTGGLYDPAKRRANGGVVSGSSANPAIKVGSSHIYGKVETAPGGGVIVGAGSIGDTNWVSGIEPGWTNNTFNFAFPDPASPTGYETWLPPEQGPFTIGGTNYSYRLAGDAYAPDGFSMGSGEIMIVTAPSRFFVGGNLTINAGYIYIAPGATLELYGGGDKTTITGGGVANGTGLARNFSYIGMPNNADVSYSGGAAFIGTVYAPYSNFSISGSASFFGAGIVSGFQLTGGGSVHYDESLGVPAPFVLGSYREL